MSPPAVVFTCEVSQVKWEGILNLHDILVTGSLRSTIFYNSILERKHIKISEKPNMIPLKKKTKTPTNRKKKTTLLSTAEGSWELRLSPEAVALGKHGPTPTAAISTWQLCPAELLIGGCCDKATPDCLWRHLCATERWMAASDSTAPQLNSF